jgi:hypothetical protein
MEQLNSEGHTKIHLFLEFLDGGEKYNAISDPKVPLRSRYPLLCSLFCIQDGSDPGDGGKKRRRCI